MLNVKTIISSGVKIATRIGKEKAPELLMALGVVAFGATCVAVAKAAPEAEFNRKFLKEELADEPDTKVKVERYCNEVVRPYLPAIGFGAVSLGAFFGSHILEKRKTAAAILALGALDRSFAAYRDEHPTPIKYDSDYIPVEETPVPEKQLIPGTGDTLFYDKVGARWFYNTEGRIRDGESKVNKELLGALSVPQNFLYSCWGIDDDGYAGEALGFDIKCPCDIIMRSTMTPDHKPAIALIYSTTIIDANQLKR